MTHNQTLRSSLLLCLALLAPLACLGETAVPYPLAQPPRLADYLPPPPSADSAAAVADLGAVLEAQRLRTPEQVRRVRAHDQWEDNVFPSPATCWARPSARNACRWPAASSIAPRKTWSRS